MVKKRLKGGCHAAVALMIVCSAILSGCASGSGTGVDSSAEGSATDAFAQDPEASSGHTVNVVEQTYFPELPTNIVDTEDLFVAPVEGISDDFIRGMDISSLLAEEKSGVKYYDADGAEQDLFKILADAGINCIRVRVWNDPFDADGNGYGGGNCNAETAAELGARAAEYGMDLCVDFHYSDFWADPNKQMRPKAWEEMRFKDRKQALYDYTLESLRTILDSGAHVKMVQLGNETNHGLAGETNFERIAELIKCGIIAVKDAGAIYGTDILTVVHFTSVDDTQWICQIADKLAENQVDYDVFGVSYYPYWHGEMTNLVNVLKYVSDTYNKKTCVMETSYMYTVEDGDGSGNSVSDQDAVAEYPVSVQSQATCVRDVCAAASEAGAMGVFYWEGAWIPVPDNGNDRSAVWEEYGSGWASSYSASYDPEDAGKYYGGCSWENQAFFDFEGHVLPSLDVFKYLKYGARGRELKIVRVEDIELSFAPGDEIVLPSVVPAYYNDASNTDALSLGWAEDDTYKAMMLSKIGEYDIIGYADTEGVACADTVYTASDGHVRIHAHVSIANENLLSDPSFEEDDHSAWIVNDIAGNSPTDFQNKSADAYTGDVAFHFWSESDMEFSVEQEITAEKTGIYRAECQMQGGDFKDDSEIYLYVKVNDEVYESDPVTLDGWVQWKTPYVSEVSASEGDTVTVGAYVKCNARAWATFDDFSLNLQ